MTFAKNAFCAVYKYSGLMRLQERVSSWTGKSFMTIVLFHRVTDDIPEDGLTVTTRWFRGFCRLVRDRFRAVPLSEIVRYVRGRERPPRRLVAITFDDCYRDNLFAARVLAEHGLPATFFLPTQAVGTDHVFPWDAGLPRLANLTWNDVREMVSLGHDIGSHTVTHPNMSQLSDEAARRELTESRRTIEDRTGRTPRFFAYPFGDGGSFLPRQVSFAQEAGYEACFSGFGGVCHPSMAGPILPREPVPYFRSLLNLELHMTGCLDWIYAVKRKAGMLN
ncbi:MAG: polysaccharide deacetylase family protein [Gemmataceae bacterium]